MLGGNGGDPMLHQSQVIKMDVSTTGQKLLGNEMVAFIGTGMREEVFKEAGKV